MDMATLSTSSLVLFIISIVGFFIGLIFIYKQGFDGFFKALLFFILFVYYAILYLIVWFVSSYDNPYDLVILLLYVALAIPICIVILNFGDVIRLLVEPMKHTPWN